MCIDSYGSLLPSGSGTEYQSAQLNLSILTFLQTKGVKIHIFNHINSTKIFKWHNITNWNRYSQRNHNKNFIFNIQGDKGIVIGDCQWTNDHFTKEFICNNVAILDEEIFAQSLQYFRNLVAQDSISHPYYHSNNQRTDHRVYFKSLSSFTPYHPKDHYFQEMEYKAAKFYFNEISPSKTNERKTLQCLERELLEQTSFDAIYTTPYFCPDLDLQKTFILNKNKIRILIGKYKYCPYIFTGVRYALRKLLPHNIKIFRYNGAGNLHYKDLISDNFSFIKTSNGEGRSRFFNQESGVIIDCKDYADFNRQKIESDLENSELISRPYTIQNSSLLLDTIRPLFYHHL